MKLLIHEKSKSYVEELWRTMKSYDSLCYRGRTWRTLKEQKEREQQLRKDMHALHQAEMRIALLEREL